MHTSAIDNFFLDHDQTMFIHNIYTALMQFEFVDRMWSNKAIVYLIQTILCRFHKTCEIKITFNKNFYTINPHNFSFSSFYVKCSRNSEVLPSASCFSSPSASIKLLHYIP